LAPHKKDKGKIYVRFSINCKDEVANIEVIQNHTNIDDEQILDVLDGKTKWQSGVQSGRKVDCYSVVTFKLRRRKFKIL